MLLSIYRFLTSYLIEPFLKHHVHLRLKKGKEDATRYRERYGVPTLKRPPGSLIWFHAASVGESLSILTLVDHLNRRYPTLNFLITTSTMSSAKLIEQRLPKKSFHQFVPFDAKRWVRRFLAYWQPSLAIWIESELWPNLTLETFSQKIPLILLNARLSDRSYQRWRWLKGFIKSLLNCFAFCISPSSEQASRLKSLGASNVITIGNLKFSSNPLSYQENDLKELQTKIKQRPTWLAASTHPSEEILISEAHALIRQNYPDLLTMIIPRHPERGSEIIEQLHKNFKIARRAMGELPSNDTEIYLCDTLGETGLFYRLNDIVFVGGSLVPIGGHNLIEPALLHSVILHGPYTHKSRELVALFQTHQASIEIKDSTQLAEKVIELLNNSHLCQKLSQAAFDLASAQNKTLEQVIKVLSPYLNQIGEQS
ncbi:MAG: 3-deoxy-D-manno-octulosonic acid transferase [Candidatus Paracaedimonas acanthamoebae]|uniref:3-deoxy-D-manno-octulosonic acid transferase n=1 Tax=Candidatus Paracaedimonas acanthamoebae TaxID=244581 RepID=A0A8J7PZK3_9PROT|nr:3-deoxy-D-manno-octulosonic acid transferase [Candidatus Paracaedimonas acanthamoebae]